MLLLAAALGLAACSSALAGPLEATAVCLEAASARACGSSVEAKFDARFSPQRLSRSEQTPLSPWVSMRFKPSEVSPIPALKEFEIEEDRHLRLNLNQVPVCPPGNVDEPPMKQRCKKALVGSGDMEAVAFFPETAPIPLHSEVTIYNAGRKHRVRTLLMDAFITVPTPAEVITTVEVKHSDRGRYGLKLVGSVPKIAGGAGSITYLGFGFHRSIFSATCPDRHLNTRFTTTFIDGTFLGGTVSRDCTPAP